VNECAVSCDVPELREQARALAQELGLPGVALSQQQNYSALLLQTVLGLQLQQVGAKAAGPVMVDFGAGNMRRRRRGGHNEPLGKAVGIGRREGLKLIDATAGLGRDSFVLADLGCEVTLLECSPIAFALLRDGIQRARHTEDPWLREVAERMHLHHTDSIAWLANTSQEFDVVYLDPMFPSRKKSARVKKEMWLFQQLIGHGPGEAALLEQALKTAQWRVVVKRPAKAPSLQGPRPHHAITGKTVRFDVYSCD
jgi:16S rRNA (guanine1516-N2)-methyltransferase